MACQETTEALLEWEKPTSVDTKPEAAQQYEVRKGDAAVMPVGGPKKGRKDRKLASEQRGNPKERPKGKIGYQK
jgi:hypothetical protein